MLLLFPISISTIYSHNTSVCSFHPQPLPSPTLITTLFKDPLPLASLGEIKSTSVHTRAYFSTNASIYLLLLGLVHIFTCFAKDHGILEQPAPLTAGASTMWASAEE